jgi:hypothetical protein
MAESNSGIGEQTPQDGERLALSVAAFRLRLTYHQTRDLMLTGKLRGVEDDGRFYVYADSVAEYLEAQGAA